MSWGIFTCTNCGTEQECRRYKQKYCNASCQLKFEYRSGKRNPIKTLTAAHRSIADNGQPKLRGKAAAWLSSPDALLIKEKISISKTGVAVPKLRKSTTKDKSYWKSPEYQAWRKQVMRRDKFTCVHCGDDRGGNLEADHILPVSLFPELMLQLTNGRTLCKPCHYQTATWGAKCKKLSRLDFIEEAIL